MNKKIIYVFWEARFYCPKVANLEKRFRASVGAAGQALLFCGLSTDGGLVNFSVVGDNLSLEFWTDDPNESPPLQKNR